MFLVCYVPITSVASLSCQRFTVAGDSKCFAWKKVNMRCKKKKVLKARLQYKTPKPSAAAISKGCNLFGKIWQLKLMKTKIESVIKATAVLSVINYMSVSS